MRSLEMLLYGSVKEVKKWPYCEKHGSNHFSRYVSVGVKRTRFKALAGRCHKKDAWVTVLYPYLLSKFERLRIVVVKFSSGFLL